MKNRIIVYFIAGLFMQPVLQAQEKPVFGSQNFIGMLEGESGTSLQLQTINGVRYKSWFAGLGTGLDYYYERSIPVFLSLNRLMNPTRLPLYLHADAGLNIPWVPGFVQKQWGSSRYTPGLYWAGGIGYKFDIGKKCNNALLLDLGYSYKRYQEKSDLVFPCLVPPCPSETERYDYRLRRLSLKLGWMF